MIRRIHENHLDRSKVRYFGVSRDDPQLVSDDKLQYDTAILASHGAKEGKR